MVPGHTERSFRRVENAVSNIVQAGAMPVVFGGDHSISIPTFKAFHDNLEGKFGVVISTIISMFMILLKAKRLATIRFPE